ncbi:MAG: ABC transporter permease [Spirochaetales bacterium]|nr:ABC transporter permease [Spirochaetales bacterium]
MNQFTAMVKARTMEFVRDRATFFWNLLFPILLVFGFSFAFSGNQDTLFKVGEWGTPSGADPFRDFHTIEEIDFISYGKDQSLDELLKKLRMHQLDLVVDYRDKQISYNEESVNAPILQRLYSAELKGSGWKEESVQGAPIRYVDWLVPGVIGMNMLFSCLFGVGFVIVRYRKNGVLKRLKATPVTAMGFVSAQMVSRFIIVLLTSVFVFLGTNLFLHFMMLGSYFNLILLTMLAILCMLSLGLIFAARFKSEELASGILNLISFPMMIFSGVFFSLEGTPPIIQSLSKIFPLTHFIEGARAVMLEGAGLVQILPQIGILGAMTVGFLLAAAFLFQWD